MFNKNVSADEEICVIGHRNPDADSACSAIACARLLSKLGYNAKAYLASKANNETKFAFDCLDLKIPPVLIEAENRRFVLVDHSSYSQVFPGIENKDILAIIDHHEDGDISADDIFTLRMVLGSTCTLIYLLYKQYEVEIDRETARIMLIGMMSDTANMASNVTEYDRQAYDELHPLARLDDINLLYVQMSKAYMAYEGLSDYEILMADYKEYQCEGYHYGFSSIRCANEADKVAMADRIYKVMEEHFVQMKVDMLYARISNKEDDNMYMLAYDGKAVKILDDIYHNYDGSRYFVFNKALSRKKRIVPDINEYLLKQSEA